MDRLADKLPAGWPAGRADRGLTLELVALLRGGQSEAACQLAAEKLGGGSGAQPVWDERGKSPVLAAGHEAVRRGADRGAGGQRVLPGPGVGPVGVHADRQVLHDSDLGRGGFELPLEEPLQPLVKAHARGVRLREARDIRQAGAAVL